MTGLVRAANVELEMVRGKPSFHGVHEVGMFLPLQAVILQPLGVLHLQLGQFSDGT